MLDRQEAAAIDELQELANKWPDTLFLFSWSGSLVAVRQDDGEVVAHIHGIPNDGGDPDSIRVDDREYIVR